MLVEEILIEKCGENGVVPPTITRLKSGPPSGDQLSIAPCFSLGLCIVIIGSFGWIFVFFNKNPAKTN